MSSGVKGSSRSAWLPTRLSELRPLPRLRACGANWMALDHRPAIAGVVRRCRQQHFKVMVWTVNDEREIRYWLSRQRIDILVTDRPALAVAIRGAGVVGDRPRCERGVIEETPLARVCGHELSDEFGVRGASESVAGSAHQEVRMADETVSATTIINAPATAIFAVLTDPARHAAIDGTGWVREPFDSRPLTAAGKADCLRLNKKLSSRAKHWPRTKMSS